MAKTKMICPFSERLCKDCPIYRGRHYYICFKPDYRGYVKNAAGQEIKKVAFDKPVGSNINISYDILKFNPGHVYDPFVDDENEYEKGRY